MMENMCERQKLCKIPAYSTSTQPTQNQDENDNTETLLLSGGGTSGQLILSHNNASSEKETNTTLPNLSENNVARMRWLEEDDSDEDIDYNYQDNISSKHHQIHTENITPRFANTRKMLPKIYDSAKVRTNIFNDPRSLCNKIKMSCNISAFGTGRRSSYTGISGDASAEESLISSKPSIQGTALLRKNRGEKAQLIDADDFMHSAKEMPIQRSIEFKKPWSKSRIFVGRPQSGQPVMSKRSMSESYGSMEMTCVGSKIRTDLAEPPKLNPENRAQKAARKFRNIRARSASLVEKTLQ
ncbi:uncharacterized protein LOC120346910 [Styela clava]